MKKIWVFGSTGMLGHVLVNELKKEPCFHIVELNSTKLPINDIEDIIAIGRDINEFKPDFVINCAGRTKQNILSNDPQESYKTFIINSLFPSTIARICSLKIKFIHISTDCVFNGQLPIGQFYDELSIPNAEDLYGLSKIRGESQLALNIRCSIIGPEIKSKKGLFEWFRNNPDKEVRGFNNHYWNGLTTLELSRILISIIKNNQDIGSTNIKHIYSKDIITKEQLLKHLSVYYKKNIWSIQDRKSESGRLNPINRALWSVNPVKHVAKPIEYQIDELMRSEYVSN